MSVPQPAAGATNAQSMLALLSRIGDAAGNSHTFAQTVQAAIAEICVYTGWPAGHAHLVDRSGEVEKLISACGWQFSRATPLEHLAATTSARISFGEGLPGLVWQRRTPLFFRRIGSMDARFLKPPNLKTGAWFGIPVILDKQIEAVLEFCTDSSGEIDRPLLASVNSIGVILACALQRERLRFLNLVVEKAHDAVIVYSVDRSQPFPLTIAYVNDALERQSGYAASELLGNPRHLLQGPSLNDAFVADVIRRLLAGETIQKDVLKYRKDGSTFWVEMTMRPLMDARGEPEYVVTVQRDITERKRTEVELQLLSTALECANDMISVIERRVHDRWRFSFVNDAFVSATGFSRDEIVGSASRILEGPETDIAALREMRGEIVAGRTARREVAFYRKDGSIFWADVNARPIVDSAGIATHAVVLYHDITAARERTALLSYEAAHDPLTGLYNRRYFIREVENVLRGGDPRRDHAVLFMDLDRFKMVNDLHGHAAGDFLLEAVSERLRDAMREGDVFARVGGDEFAVLLHDCSPQAALAVADHILAIVREFSSDYGDESMRVGVSIGIAGIAANDGTPAEVMHRADQACYAAKHGGGNRAVLA